MRATKSEWAKYGGGGPAWFWPTLPIGRLLRSRRAGALSASAAFHLLLGVGLLLQFGREPYGAYGPGLGTGIQVSLVSGFAEGGADAGSRAIDTEADDDQTEHEAAAPVDAGAATSAVPPTAEEQEARRRTDNAAALAAARDGEAANAFEGAVGASAAQGGDPTATSDLLAQVARCLPPDFRPRLAFSHLTLAVGADGRLRTAPEVHSTAPRLAASDRAAADRIVQAALLCGPYAHPDALNRVVTLAADFSALAKGAASAR